MISLTPMSLQEFIAKEGKEIKTISVCYDVGEDSKKGRVEANSLDLSEYPELTTIDINGNQLDKRLVDINLSNCKNLDSLLIFSNDLNSIDFLVNLPCPEKLKYLDISNNNIEPTNLVFLKTFINLEYLYIGSCCYQVDKRVLLGIRNRFYGSLEPLKNLTKLKDLDVINTDIDSGLEYLPDSIKTFECQANGNIQNFQARVKKISNSLEPFLIYPGNYD
jgi:hypothetical protein